VEEKRAVAASAFHPSLALRVGWLRCKSIEAINGHGYDFHTRYPSIFASHNWITVSFYYIYYSSETTVRNGGRYWEWSATAEFGEAIKFVVWLKMNHFEGTEHSVGCS
jgi:hypothetical protein